MGGEASALERAFTNFFTRRPIFPPAPIIDYSSEGVSRNKITSWAVMFSFLVTYLIVMIIGILAIMIALMMIGVSEGPSFSISSKTKPIKFSSVLTSDEKFAVII